MTEFTQERIAHDRNLVNMASCLKWITETEEYSGNDWLVFTMNFETGHDNKEHYIYVTTDHVHGTEYGTAEDDAAYVMAAVNGYPDALDEIDTLRARIAELEEANRWIPVSEKLPEEGDCVNILLPNGTPTFGYWIELECGDPDEYEKFRPTYQQWYTFTDGQELDYIESPEDEPTHWHKAIPLPSAPEADR